MSKISEKCGEILAVEKNFKNILNQKISEIENSKNCNNFHTGSKLEIIIPNNTKNRGFKVSKSISPFFRLKQYKINANNQKVIIKKLMQINKISGNWLKTFEITKKKKLQWQKRQK